MKKKAEIKSGSTEISEYIVLPVILILTVIAYSGIYNLAVLNFDDIEYFSRFPEVLELSWKNVMTYFSKHYVLMYQPLPILTFAINYHFSQMNLMPLHLVNFLFHVCNIILIWKFIFSLRNNKNEAHVIAAVFALHPLNTEAVTWISARSSSMYVFFFLVGLLCYLNYLKQDLKLKYLFFTVLFFILSLLSKAQAVTFPLVLVILDYLYNRKWNVRTIGEKLPFFILSIIFGLIALADKETQTNLTEGMLINYNIADIFFMVCWSVAFYIIKFFFPFNQCSVYVYPPKTDGLLPLSYYASALVAGFVIWLVWRNRHNRMLVFSAGFFFLIISINIQVIPSRLFIVTERYGYLPYAGLMLFLAELIRVWRERDFGSYRKYITTLSGAAGIYILFFALLVHGRNKVWASDLTLMDDIISKNERVPYIYRAYGIRGLYKINNGDMQGGVNDFTEAIAIYPADGKTYMNRALAYQRLGNNSSAIQDMDSAVIKSADRPELYSYRAIIGYQMGRAEQAWVDCNKCLQIDSSFVDCYITRGTIAFGRNDTLQSIRDFSKAIELQPSGNVAYKNRGTVYLQINEKDKGCADIAKAMELGNTEAFQIQQAYCR